MEADECVVRGGGEGVNDDRDDPSEACTRLLALRCLGQRASQHCLAETGFRALGSRCWVTLRRRHRTITPLPSHLHVDGPLCTGVRRALYAHQGSLGAGLSGRISALQSVYQGLVLAHPFIPFPSNSPPQSSGSLVFSKVRLYLTNKRYQTLGGRRGKALPRGLMVEREGKTSKKTEQPDRIKNPLRVHFTALSIFVYTFPMMMRLCERPDVLLAGY